MIELSEKKIVQDLESLKIPAQSSFHPERDYFHELVKSIESMQETFQAFQKNLQTVQESLENQGNPQIPESLI